MSKQIVKYPQNRMLFQQLKKTILPDTTWMKLKSNMLYERNQTQNAASVLEMLEGKTMREDSSLLVMWWKIGGIKVA